MAEDSLDADPFLTALRSRLERTFEGTAVELLSQVIPAEETWRPPREWPKNSRQVTTLLRRNTPALRHAGWMIEDLGADNNAARHRLALRPRVSRPVAPVRLAVPNAWVITLPAPDAEDVAPRRRRDAAMTGAAVGVETTARITLRPLTSE